MPHAMTDGFSVDDTLTDATGSAARAVASVATSPRQQESETPNERAMRAATAASKKTGNATRQQG